MRKVINTLTGVTVLIGDTILLPGGFTGEIESFEMAHVAVKPVEGLSKVPPDFRYRIPMGYLFLEWREVKLRPEDLMTFDDWIHATNEAKETGGHFMSYLARAYQHADGNNVKAIKENYASRFFRFLSRERMEELKEAAK